MSFPQKGTRDLTADEANAQWAIEKLKSYSDESDAEPFFMGIGFMRPHTPLIVPQRFYDQYPLESLELPKILQGDAEDTYLTKSRGGNDRGLKLFNSLVSSYDGDVELALKHFTQAYLVGGVDRRTGRTHFGCGRSILLKTIPSLYLPVTTVGAQVLKIMLAKIPFGKKAHVFHLLFERLELPKRAQM